MDAYTVSTRLLDFKSPELRQQREHLLTNIAKPKEQLKALYDYVAALPICYTNDDRPASSVFAEQCGQCNTKVTLLMALARGAGIPARLHAYTLHKHVQQDRIPAWMLHFAPPTTVFFWPEFFVNKRWQQLHNVVFEQKKDWDSCPFDGACYLEKPLKEDWIAEDKGVWDSPDQYLAKHKPTIHGWRKLGWNIVGKRVLNTR